MHGLHAETSGPAVRVLGALALSDGTGPVGVPPGSRRLLAYLALQRGVVDRRASAGVLWPTVPDGRAAGNLRSELWRLQQVGCPLVQAGPAGLGLDPSVVVDLRLVESWATRVITGAAAAEDLLVDPARIGALDLLPGWYDDWVLTIRDRLRLRLLHALEALGVLLQRAGRPAEAVEAVHVAVLTEPLRESGQRALIEAHQQAGDWVAARRQYDAFRLLLRREIGVEPSDELTAVATRRHPWPRPGSRPELATGG
jgi:DNA-binding SARP family transcriptional activator